MKKLLFTVLFLSNLFIIYAQKEKQVANCGTDELHQKMLITNPEYRKAFELDREAWSDFALKYSDKNSKRVMPAEGVTLPVVFHNFSTTDYSIANYNTFLNTLDGFYNPNDANHPELDTNIHFCLARRDLNGDQELSSDELTSLSHVYPFAGDFDKSVAGNITALRVAANTNFNIPTANYIHIYIVDEIVDGANTDVTGFATLPPSHGEDNDGIYIERGVLNGDTDSFKTLVHEMGHYLGLFHTFERTIAHENIFFNETDGHAYQLIEENLSWVEARDYAVARGGRLVSINSAAEQIFIESAINIAIANGDIDIQSTTADYNGSGGKAFVWIGGTDIDIEGTYVWADGSSFLTYGNWSNSQPNNLSNEDGLAMALENWDISPNGSGSIGEWNDLDLGNTLYFIIEYDDVNLITNEGIPYNCDLNDNCMQDGDWICDTPPHLNPIAIGATTNIDTCVQTPANTCSDFPVQETDDPVANYMNYSPHSCKTEFSPGQVLRMQFIIDPDYGARSSLLDESVDNLTGSVDKCVDCPNLNECEFTVTPSGIPTDRTANRYTILSTENINISVVYDCVSTSPNVNYSWELYNLQDLETTISTGDSNSIDTSTLGVNNYMLNFYVTDTNDAVCTENQTYYFSIINPPPTGDDCNDWSTYTQISYSDGNWVGGTADATIDAAGFELITDLSGTFDGDDTNFTGINKQPNSNITEIYRVGNNILSNGTEKAHYIQQTFTITPENNWFRVWYLGGYMGTQTPKTLFFTEGGNSAFGWLCEYKVTNLANNLVTLGSDPVAGTGTQSNRLRKNDMISNRLNENLSGDQITNNFHHTTSWKSMDLDFSYFSNLSPSTEVTITFFSHSSYITDSQQSAYAYFGMECLNPVTPHYNFEIDDFALACNENSITYNFPDFNYVNPQNFLSMDLLHFHPINTINYNLIDISLERIDALGNSFDPQEVITPNLISIGSHEKFKIGNLRNYDTDIVYFRLTFQTLNETIVNEFSVVVNGYESEPFCLDGGTIDLLNYPSIQLDDNIGYILVCDNQIIEGDIVGGNGEFPIQLEVSPSCVEGLTINIDNRWSIAGWNGLIDNHTTTLTINNVNSYVNSNGDIETEDASIFNREIVRRIIYVDPNCESNNHNLFSQTFSFLDLAEVNITHDLNDIDPICYGNDDQDVFNIDFERIFLDQNDNLALFDYSFDHDYTFTFQIEANIGDTDDPDFIAVGDSQSTTFTGLLDNYIINNLNFAIQNTRNGAPLFVPIGQNDAFNMRLHIFSTDYVDCPVDEYIDFEVNMSRTAIAGEIVYNCNERIITSSATDDSWTADNIYGWEYYNATATWIVLPDETGEALDLTHSLGSDIYYNLSSQFRRFSWDTNNCKLPDEASYIPPHTALITITPPPTTPDIGSITQPTCTILGSVQVSFESDENIISLQVYDASNVLIATYDDTPLPNPVLVEDLATGTYTFTVTNDLDCESDTSATITIDEAPIPPDVPTITTVCDLATGTAIVDVESPIDGNTYEYAMDDSSDSSFGSVIQFIGLGDGSHTLYVRLNATPDCVSSLDFETNCSCDDAPLVSLDTDNSSICGLDAITIGGTFTNANVVSITSTGSGVLGVSSITTTPFSVIYTPSTADIDTNVTITFTTDNPNGGNCTAFTAVYTLNVNEALAISTAITQPTCTANLGSIVLGNLPSTWELEYGGIVTQGTTNTKLISDLTGGDYVFTITNTDTGCTVTLPAITINDALVIPDAPIIADVLQPQCNVAGSMTFNNLPAGNWELHPFLDGVALPVVLDSGLNYTYEATDAGTYTFTVGLANGGCESTLSNTENIVEVQIITPTFNLPFSYCDDIDVPILPETSDNRITGTWEPLAYSTGESTYIFTSDVGQCAASFTQNILYTSDCSPQLELYWDGDVSCQGTNVVDFKAYSDIIDGPCIRVCELATLNYHLGGNTELISSTEWHAIGGETSNESITDCTITWDDLAQASLEIIIHYVNGNTNTISLCIEKLEGPDVKFGVMPDIGNAYPIVCIGSEVIFENLTTINSGNEVIYYNWDFGDNNFSNEFEPTHLYTHEGFYTVTLTAFNGCSCVDTYDMKLEVAKTDIPITCVSIACEGGESTYSVPDTYSNSELIWHIEGGDQVWHNGDNTEIRVLWNNIEHKGFGYVNLDVVGTPCTTVVKVPIIKMQTVIEGAYTLCENGEGVYTLPQWATTEFDWHLDANGTGAVLVEGLTQRNEVIIKTKRTGDIYLTATYHNTLLDCGGFAGEKEPGKPLQIHVQPAVHLDEFDTLCTGINTLEFKNNNNNTVNDDYVVWELLGPNGFTDSGTGNIESDFTEAGTYVVTASSTRYCFDVLPTIEVKQTPATPQADAIEDETIKVCAGLSYTYTCTVPDEDYLVYWEVENGTIQGSAIGSHVTVIYDDLPIGGQYILSVHYEQAGCSSEVLAMPIALDVPEVALNANANLDLIQFDYSVCGSSIRTYKIADLDGIDYIHWQVADDSAGSIAGADNTESVNVLWNHVNTTTHLILTIRKCGTNYEYETEDITISRRPDVVDNGSDITICTTDNYHASIQVEDDYTVREIVWDFGDGTPPLIEAFGTTNTETNYTQTHVYTDPLDDALLYQVQVTVRADGCAESAVITLPVYVLPMPVALLTPTNSVSYCLTNNYTLNTSIDTDGDGYSNTVEAANGTNPTDPCDPANNPRYTHFDPNNNLWIAADCDNDGISNGDEFANETDPYNANNVERTLTANLQGVTNLSTLQWFRDGNPIPNTTGVTSIDIGVYAFGMYSVSVSNTIAVDTDNNGVTENYGCETESNSVYIKNICGSPCGIPIANMPNVTANATVGACGEVVLSANLDTATFNAWQTFSLPAGAQFTPLANNGLQVNNLAPGNYNVKLQYSIDYVDNTVSPPVTYTCADYSWVNFIIPYQADLKYEVLCNGNGTYNVTLFDHSVYYPETPYTHLNFLVNGTAMYSTNVSLPTVTQHTFELQEGQTYTFGIEINNAQYASWIKTFDLDLPLTPDATFTFDTDVCEGNAVHFQPTQAIDSSLSYYWDFGDDTINLKPDPVRVYTTNGDDGLYMANLTVTNQFGCSATSNQLIRIKDNKINGEISNPTPVCEGNSVTLSYEPNTLGGEHDVSSIEWFQSSSENSLGTDDTITVSENGYYFVYITDEFGCRKVDVKPRIVLFTPTPEAPVITAPETVCYGEVFTVSVPENEGVTYQWQLNGIDQPDWSGHTVSYDPTTTVGNLVFSVRATTADSTCTSELSTVDVLVLDELEVPEINFTQIYCTPYKVQLGISNVQSGVHYYWSNGNIGDTAVITHSGPIQVRAEVQGCSTTSQIDLPIDLSTLAWTFPRGCYDTCIKKDEPKSNYLVGPIGDFNLWEWQENWHDVAHGTGTVPNFHYLYSDHSYQLYLKTNDCKTTFANLELNYNENCTECKIHFEIIDVACTYMPDETPLYFITFAFENEIGAEASVSLHLPDNQGYFTPSNVLLPEGYSEQGFYFIPATTNFVYDEMMQVRLEGQFKEEICIKEDKFRLKKCEAYPKIAQERRQNMLVLQPNPATHTTKVLYVLATAHTGVLQVSNMLGTVFYKEELKEQQGSIVLDISNLVQGVYDVSIIQNGTHVVHSKLIKK